MADGDVIGVIGLMIATGVGAVFGAFVYLVVLAFFGMLDQSSSIPSPGEGAFAGALDSMMNAVMIGFAAAGAAGADYIYLFKILGRQV